METEPEFDQVLPPQPDSISPAEDGNHLFKLKRLKTKSHSMEINFDNTNSTSSPLNESDDLEKVSEWDHDDDDGLDPLFGDANQFSAKRVLEFDDNESGFSQNDADFELGSAQNKKKRTRVSANKQELKIKEKTNKEKSAIQKDKKERQAQIAQHADYQRVMRERKGVGFKPTPMVEKSISSVLEKIRQRKLELSRKMMSSRSGEQTGFDNLSETSTSVAQINMTSEDDKPGMGDDQTRCEYAAEISTDAAPLDTTHKDKPETSDEQTNTIDVPLVDETTQSFRAPINDTQDLLLDSERSFSQGDELNESSFPVEDIAPSAPSLNLKFDSALPDDDISSDEEESDKENIEPHPKHEFRGRSTTTGDPVKAFVDEEALEDDSDNDLLHSQDKDDEDDSDMEENCDYIATDFKEKQTDREKINQLHQQWDQQQDETRTKNLLQKLKYGTKSEPSLLDEDDDDKNNAEKENAEGIEVEEDEDEDDESDKDVLQVPATRPTTKKLKAMIPQMFTDEDDGFVSSEDEETEKRLSKQCLLQKVELEQQTKFLSPAEDETSREVFCRIKKLNVIPETKKAKASSFFDALLTKGSSTNTSKSSFLRRASTHPGASSHRQGSSTGKSFIFGRDDSNSRSSMSLLEDSPNMGQKENQVKKNSSAKFTGSQAKWSTQRTEAGGETTSSTSLFDILKRSSVQTGFDDTRDNLADQQAVFAAFKSVKKQVKIERRSYQGP